MQNDKKNLENSPDTATRDSTVQTINAVTFITCPAVGVPMLKIEKKRICYFSTVFHNISYFLKPVSNRTF